MSVTVCYSLGANFEMSECATFHDEYLRNFLGCFLKVAHSLN